MVEKKQINVEIGQNVKLVRENAGLTQERLAELMGMGEKHISAIECGAVGLSLPALKRLCSLLAVSADAILFGTAGNGKPDDNRTAAIQFITDRLSHLSDEQFWAVKDILDKVLSAMTLHN